MPSIVVSNRPAKAESVARSVAVPELVPRNCTLDPAYEPIEVDTFTVSGELITYTSPDSTFAVTKRLIDGAKNSILIGIYDFTAAHIKELLLAAMRRGVKVKLMLDIDGAGEAGRREVLLRLRHPQPIAPHGSPARQPSPARGGDARTVPWEYTRRPGRKRRSQRIHHVRRLSGFTPPV